MEIILKEILNKIKKMDMEYINILKDKNMKENIKMI
jgi:hypothetical protein